MATDYTSNGRLGGVAFHVSPNANQNDMASGQVIGFGAERFDTGSNFAANAFVAPVTGKYLFAMAVRLDGADPAAAWHQIYLHTSNRLYEFIADPVYDPTYYSADYSVLCDMDASDTAYLTFNFSGGSATTDLSYPGATWFSGYLAA